MPYTNLTYCKTENRTPAPGHRLIAILASLFDWLAKRANSDGGYLDPGRKA